MATFILGSAKEQLEKSRERDANMAKAVAQLKVLMKHVMGTTQLIGSIRTNEVYPEGNLIYNVNHNEEANWLSTQIGSFCLSYYAPIKNQGWNPNFYWNNEGGGWRDYDSW